MPRQLRHFVEGIPCHLTLRGVDRQDIFSVDGDRSRFLTYLQEGCGKHDVQVHAYVLMSNHVHLLATPGGPESFARTVQHLGRRYVPYVNRRYERTGPLWDGRYRSTWVSVDRYFFACHRYIELNPVRAGMVQRPDQFHWSSYHHNGGDRSDPLVDEHEVYMALGEDCSARRAAYRALFESPLSPSLIDEIRTSSRLGRPLGSDDFCRRLEARCGAPLRPGRRGRRKRLEIGSDPIF